MKKTKIFSLLAIIFFILSIQVYGQQKKQPPQYRQEPAPITVHKISEHVYEARGGSGANCQFIIGEGEVYVADAKMTDQSAKDLIAAIKKTTDKSIKHLLITHSDGDHVNGIPGFPEGINIISHDNSPKNIKSAGADIPLPNITFDHRLNLYSGDLEINLMFFGNAHTDDNIVIYIPNDNIAIMGDLFFKGMDPLIHKHKNGTSEGLANVLKEVIDLDAETYLSGHAEPVKKDEIEDLRNTVIEKRKKVKAMVKDGKNLDDIKKAFGVGQSRWPSLVEIIYGEITQ
jgi:glyoxylase-like metal-dependent hydrolase (beta-lactamase superfamily II)